ncbi:hypothetical protein [Streptomyces sp. NPDC127084]|uniref:hypothetical protein n=1 Tax=Streptomyces sp. NPDC127084 TaxID=3347133 RepID=UPI003652A609
MDTFATWTTQGIIAGSGGVMTTEGGPITGDLTVHTTWIDGQAQVTVQHTGALEWYGLAGSPVPAVDEPTARHAHQAAVELVKEGGGSVFHFPG